MLSSVIWDSVALFVEIQNPDLSNMRCMTQEFAKQQQNPSNLQLQELNAPESSSPRIQENGKRKVGDTELDNEKDMFGGKRRDVAR